ncbi:MAG: hypothetical protein SGJ09_05445 [Phycisphaerae bacterium]|nr:hypothetical protein [Phycisphaerae bacterium]
MNREEARQLLAGILDQPVTRPNSVMQLSSAGVALLALPEGELGRRWIERQGQDLGVVVKPSGSETELSIEGTEGESPVFLRVNEITLGGVPLEFKVEVAAGDEARRWHTLAYTSMRIRIIDANIKDPSLLRVRGQIASCGPIASFITGDATIKSVDDPTRWGLPCALGSFDHGVVAKSTAPRYAFGFAQPAPRRSDRWMPFLGPDSPDPAPAAIARSKNNATPERCLECGCSLRGLNSLHWAEARVRTPVAAVSALVVAGELVSLIHWSSPRLSARVAEELRRKLTTPERCGEWLGSRYVELVPTLQTDWVVNEIGSGIEQAHSNTVPLDTVAREHAVRYTAAHCRDEARGNASFDRRSSALAGWCGVIAHQIKDGSPRSDDLLPTLRELLEREGTPHFQIPLCVQVGKPITLDLGFDNLWAVTLVRQIHGDASVGAWQRAESLKLRSPDQPGELKLSLEWDIALLNFRELGRNVSLAELAKRFEQLPIGGKLSRRILVLPTSANSTPLDDPRFNPILYSRTAYLGVRHIGNRDLIWVNTHISGLGVALRGRIEIEVASASGASTVRIDLGDATGQAIGGRSRRCPIRFRT